MRRYAQGAIAPLLITILVLHTSCAVNPATGKRQLMLVSESQEQALGLESDRAISSQMGLYPDPELQSYVAELGRKLAARSERPNLNWTFRVVDDPVVNAFALPGGYIYVTRGILAHIKSEAELAAVIGHEIGHVTARHGASQMSKAQLAQGVLGVGAILASEKAERFGGLTSQGLSLLFMKFGRDDERQADDLGLRYLVAGDYDARPMSDVFDMLDRIGKASDGARVPGWISTHPAPESRRSRSEAKIATLGSEAVSGRIGEEAFLKRVDGLVFGDDPRAGYFDGSRFFHPEMRFQIEFPGGWKTENQQQAVVGVSDTNDAVVQLSLAEGATAQSELEKFLALDDIEAVGSKMTSISGLVTRGTSFVLVDESNPIRGRVAFIEYRDRIFMLMAYTSDDLWAYHESDLRRSMESFRPLTDPAALNVQPSRIQIVTVDRAMTVEAFAERQEATVSPATLALINRLDPGQRLEPGQRYKVVRGGSRP